MQPKSKRSKKMVPIYRDEYILQELKKGRDYKEICEYFDKNSKEGMWQKLNKLIKPNGAIVLFGSEPFSSALRMSNIKNYKYDWVWDKKLAGNGILAKHQPLKIHELVHIFSSKGRAIYLPQKTKGKLRKKMTSSPKVSEINNGDGIKHAKETFNDEYYPKSILEFSLAGHRKGRLHPTQKPVALMEYLIKTYTNEGELVLDFAMGSGTTGVACMNLNRKFIGIELNEKYFNIALQRIEEAKKRGKRKDE
jgi:site-specific DNA-methyltransferase (adenine-specific)